MEAGYARLAGAYLAGRWGKEDWFISRIKEIQEPAEDAFMGFLTDTDYPGKDNPEGIPAVSLLYHEGEDVIHLPNLLLPDVGREVQERGLAEKDLLYRVDYFLGGKSWRAMGTLKARSGNAGFLEWLGSGTGNGGDAETQLLSGLLRQHLALCSLEKLAGEEISRQGQEEEETESRDAGEDSLYRRANAAYYRGILAYAAESRRILNTQSCPVLPPFPERGPFLAEWYRKHLLIYNK